MATPTDPSATTPIEIDAKINLNPDDIRKVQSEITRMFGSQYKLLEKKFSLYKAMFPAQAKRQIDEVRKVTEQIVLLEKKKKDYLDIESKEYKEHLENQLKIKKLQEDINELSKNYSKNLGEITKLQKQQAEAAKHTADGVQAQIDSLEKQKEVVGKGLDQAFQKASQRADDLFFGLKEGFKDVGKNVTELTFRQEKAFKDMRTMQRRDMTGMMDDIKLYRQQMFNFTVEDTGEVVAGLRKVGITKSGEELAKMGRTTLELKGIFQVDMNTALQQTSFYTQRLGLDTKQLESDYVQLMKTQQLTGISAQDTMSMMIEFQDQIAIQQARGNDQAVEFRKNILGMTDTMKKLGFTGKEAGEVVKKALTPDQERIRATMMMAAMTGKSVEEVAEAMETGKGLLEIQAETTGKIMEGLPMNTALGRQIGGLMYGQITGNTGLAGGAGLGQGSEMQRAVMQRQVKGEGWFANEIKRIEAERDKEAKAAEAAGVAPTSWEAENAKNLAGSFSELNELRKIWQDNTQLNAIHDVLKGAYSLVLPRIEQNLQKITDFLTGGWGKLIGAALIAGPIVGVFGSVLIKKPMAEAVEKGVRKALGLGGGEDDLLKKFTGKGKGGIAGTGATSKLGAAAKIGGGAVAGIAAGELAYWGSGEAFDFMAGQANKAGISLGGFEDSAKGTVQGVSQMGSSIGAAFAIGGPWAALIAGIAETGKNLYQMYKLTKELNEENEKLLRVKKEEEIVKKVADEKLKAKTGIDLSGTYGGGADVGIGGGGMMESFWDAMIGSGEDVGGQMAVDDKAILRKYLDKLSSGQMTQEQIESEMKARFKGTPQYGLVGRFKKLAPSVKAAGGQPQKWAPGVTPASVEQQMGGTGGFGGGGGAPTVGGAGAGGTIKGKTAENRWGSIKDVMKEASGISGVPLEMLAKVSYAESGWKSDINAPTSSAGGLFQFIDSTWQDQLSKYGPQFGFGRNTPKSDARANAIMGALFIRDNLETLRKTLGREPSAGDAYMAHFLGAGTAANFISLKDSDPNLPAAPNFRKQAAANESIFYNADGTTRSMAEVYNIMDAKANRNVGFALAAQGLIVDRPTKVIAGEREPEVIAPVRSLLNTAANVAASKPMSPASADMLNSIVTQQQQLAEQRKLNAMMTEQLALSRQQVALIGKLSTPMNNLKTPPNPGESVMQRFASYSVKPNIAGR